ncbi:MAG: metal-sulfur cluster assembly factor [Actinomycetota bacterium]
MSDSERIKGEVTEALKTVNDPELGIDIINLGLVYEIDVKDTGDVHIEYSLTTMGCPIGPMIEEQMSDVIAPIEGVGQVTAELVFHPAWSPEKMTPLARSALGIV